MATIFHITTEREWEQALRRGRYEPESLVSEGFIHCSNGDQVIRVATGIFRGIHGLVLLHVMDLYFYMSRSRDSPRPWSTRTLRVARSCSRTCMGLSTSGLCGLSPSLSLRRTVVSITTQPIRRMNLPNKRLHLTPLRFASRTGEAQAVRSRRKA